MQTAQACPEPNPPRETAARSRRRSVVAGGHRLEALASARRLGHRNETADLAKPEGRHVAVDRLILTGSHLIGLVPDPRAIALADATPVVAPSGKMRICRVLGERLQMLEGPPVLHDHGQTHLVPEQALLRVRDQVVKHVLHAATAPEVDHAAKQTELGWACPDEEHDEVPVDLNRHSASSYLRHRPSFTVDVKAPRRSQAQAPPRPP